MHKKSEKETVKKVSDGHVTVMSVTWCGCRTMTNRGWLCQRLVVGSAAADYDVHSSESFVVDRCRPPLVPHRVRARPDGKNDEREDVSECSTSRYVLSRNSSAAFWYCVCLLSWSHWIMLEMVWVQWPDATVGLCPSVAPLCRPQFWDATAAACSLQCSIMHLIVVRVLTELDMRPGRFGRVDLNVNPHGQSCGVVGHSLVDNRSARRRSHYQQLQHWPPP